MEVVISNPEIGAGHLTFAMAFEKALEKQDIPHRYVSVPDDLGDPLISAFFNASRALYHLGGHGSPFTNIYEYIRDHQGGLPSILRLWLERELLQYGGIPVAAHSLTTLRNRSILLQGDISGGRAHVQSDAKLIAVPTEESKEELLTNKVPENKVFVAGFFVDDNIKNPGVIQTRIDMLKDGYVHAGIYLTGARPLDHVRLIREKLLPVLAQGNRVGNVRFTLYTFTDEELGDNFLWEARGLGMRAVRYEDDSPDGNWDARVIYGKSPREAVDFSLKALGYDKFPINLLITMTGERVGWPYGMPVLPLPPINRVNAGNNTKWLISRNICEGMVTGAESLTTALEHPGDLINKIQLAQKFIDPNGAENTVKFMLGRPEYWAGGL